MRRKKKICLWGERDFRLLVFLWKWKVSTTAVLAKKFFPTSSLSTAYKRLWTLEQGDFVKSVCDKSGKKFIWTLGKRGFAVAKSKLPFKLLEDGFKSESPGHDLLTAAFQLGDWLLGSPQNVVLFSEQQLRRYDKEHYPEWLPRTDYHRADGYIYFEKAKKIVAVEVEINAKAKSAYGEPAGFYSLYHFDFVLWLVPSPSFAQSIAPILNKEVRRHSFVVFSDFASFGWRAKIICGKSMGQTIESYLYTASQNSFETSSKPVSTELTLNCAKAPHRSASYKQYEIGDFSD